MSGLIFIRHAETDMAGTFCGHSNPPVNERGLQQIAGLQKVVADEAIDAIYTSDLKRAVVTASALTASPMAGPIESSNLREINFGDWEGLTWSQIEEKYPYYSKKWMDGYPNMPAPNGESFEIFQSRVLDEIKHLLTVVRRNWVAVVTHAGVMRVVLQALCGLDEESARIRTQAYCCLFKYPYEVRP
jgi:broad specificity phosphatase PhoE